MYPLNSSPIESASTSWAIFLSKKMRLGGDERETREKKMVNALATFLVDVDGLLLAGGGVCTRR